MSRKIGFGNITIEKVRMIGLVLLWATLMLAGLLYLQPSVVFGNTYTIAYSLSTVMFILYFMFSLLYVVCCMLGFLIIHLGIPLKNPKIKNKTHIRKERKILIMVFSVVLILNAFIYLHCIFDRFELKSDGAIERCTFLAEPQVITSLGQYDDVEVAIVTGRGGPAVGVSYFPIIQISSEGKCYRFDFGSFVSCEAMLSFIQLQNSSVLRFEGHENLERFIQSAALRDEEEQQWRTFFQM